MKRIIAALAVMYLAVSSGLAQDPAKVSPEHYKVEIDNQYVRVIRATRGPREKAPMHVHPENVLIFLTPVHQRITAANGMVMELKKNAGDVVFSGPVKHEEESLSDQPMEVIIIELKPGHPPIQPVPAEFDPVKAATQFHPVEFENEHVRILRASRDSSVTVPMHQHGPYVTVPLTDVHVNATSPDGTVRESTRIAGVVGFREGAKHSIQNVGAGRMEEIQVELK